MRSPAQTSASFLQESVAIGERRWVRVNVVLR